MTTIYTNKPLPERREADFYPTPRWAVETALGVVVRDLPAVGLIRDAAPWERPPTRILDVGAGAGVWGEVARELWPAAEIVGVELREVAPNPVYDRWIQGDFRDGLGPSLDADGRFDLVMGNPPFYVAEEAVRWGLGRLPFGGRLLYLLKLAFLEGQDRGANLYVEHPLKLCAVSSRRIPFTHVKNTGPTAHAFYLWQSGWRGPELLTRV